MKQTDVRSVDIVSEVAYKCLQKDQEKRPTMALVIQELEKAFNIHDGGYGQRTEELLHDASYHSHENVVKTSWIFVMKGKMTYHVVMKYASNASLDEYIHRQHINYTKHITNPTREVKRNIFPWVMRLQFCLDAARGLNFLHNGNGKNHMIIIHGNIKSSNILVSRDGVGMIGDFRLSTNEYSDTHRLTKKYDVYSFGLVLFEVMSGRLTHFKISKDERELLPDIVKHGFEQRKLNHIIDPMLKEEFDTYRGSLIGDRSAESLRIFANIAYRCFQEEVEGRPTMADIVNELEEAYRIHVESIEQMQEDEDIAKSLEAPGHLRHGEFETLKNPFKRYTQHQCFSLIVAESDGVDLEVCIQQNSSMSERKNLLLNSMATLEVKAKLLFRERKSRHISKEEFWEKSIFEKYIRNVQNLKWEQRLKICIDAAQGLNYLHNHHIIHRDVKSPNILLGDSLEGMIGDVGLSITVKNTDSQLSNITAVGTGGYVDPKYLKRDYCEYLKKDLENDEKFLDSVKTFAAITHECLHSSETHHLTMADVLKELKNALTIHAHTPYKMYRIALHPGPYKASDQIFYNFLERKERVIGSVASRKIYKAELTLFKKSKPVAVAVKRLDRARYDREGAFLKEVAKLSHYAHENIITLRGFCEEEYENIIIMDYAVNESLDKHLNSSSLTWSHRLNISIGAAKGLNHIHSFKENQNTVHGDIKSGNILLDHDWKATISDFIISKTHGTKGYLDSQSLSSGSTKETDVYSFGVVLFEILSGRRAIEKVEKYSDPKLRQIIDAGDGVKDKKVVFLDWVAARCFEDKKLEALMFDDIKEQTDAESIDILSQVAYDCLQKDQAKRPKMGSDSKMDREESVQHPYEKEASESKEITKKDLYSIFSSGIRLNNGKVLLSLNKDGKAKEMISATMFSYEKCWSSKWKVLENSRFGTVAKISNTQNLKIQIKIKTQFLSLGIIYGAYLVFKFCDPKMVSSKPYVDLKYKTASGELNSYIVERRDGEWLMIELCRFRSDNQIIDFNSSDWREAYMGTSCGHRSIFLDGIDFNTIETFEEVVELQCHRAFSINCNIETKMLSPDTAYACYLVFQLPENSDDSMSLDKRVPEHPRRWLMEVLRSLDLPEFNAIQGCQDSVEIHYFDNNKVKQRTKTVHVEYPWKPAPCNHCFVVVKPKNKTQTAEVLLLGIKGLLRGCIDQRIRQAFRPESRNRTGTVPIPGIRYGTGKFPNREIPGKKGENPDFPVPVPVSESRSVRYRYH
ncbi:phloem protein 2-like protein [Tanacetum coccineum]